MHSSQYIDVPPPLPLWRGRILQLRHNPLSRVLLMFFHLYGHSRTVLVFELIDVQHVDAPIVPVGHAIHSVQQNLAEAVYVSTLIEGVYSHSGGQQWFPLGPGSGAPTDIADPFFELFGLFGRVAPTVTTEAE